MRFISVLLLLFLMPVFAAAEELKIVKIVDGYAPLESIQPADLPKEARIVADQLVHKPTALTYEEGTLTVGVQVPQLRDGTVLAKIEQQSDCPNNTVYGVENILTSLEPNVRRATEQWTRLRHRALKAPIKQVRINPAAKNLVRTFDVRLKLDKVTLNE